MLIGATFVPPSGEIDSPLILVGEQPTKREVTLRQVFSGPSGKELTDCMNAVGLLRQESYITNVIKDLDHPLRYHMQYDKGKASVSSEWYQYLDMLRKEL